MEIGTGSLLSVFILLFTLLNIPLPPVNIPNLGVLIVETTKMLATVNYYSDLGKNPNPESQLKIGTTPTYDFIIVGAGSAGCVLANRLSENGIFKVLLLEAGGDPLALNSIPGLVFSNIGHEGTDWMYMNEPQVNSTFGAVNNISPSNKGKSLGGSSNLNGMIYMRGNPNDFDNWARLTADPGWNYQNVLEYFKKSENYEGRFPHPSYHGTGGPMAVSAGSDGQLLEDWMAAATEFGLNNSDPNSHQTSTFAPLEYTIRNGKRESTYTAFLKPALHRTNLHVIRYAHVKMINLDSSNQARGVTFQRNGETFTVTASKEVILSAGAINTPQLLMLSGIGPSLHLNSLGIHTKVNIPGVGQNLQNHVLSLLGPFILNDTVSNFPEKELTTNAVLDYAYKGKGPLSSVGIPGIGFFSTSEPKDPSWPNVVSYLVPVGIHEGFGAQFGNLFGLKEGLLESYVDGYNNKDALSILMNLGLPKTRGSVRLNSSNPFDKPLIHQNFYAEVEDLKAMVDGYKFMVNLFENSRTWQKYNATLIPKHLPGCEQFPLRSDSYYECHLRTITGTSWHECGTAKMGAIDDPMAVVDSNLKVFKVKNLRIVDASVIPVITNGNINAPVIMIAEKAADCILRDWINPLSSSLNILLPSIPIPYVYGPSPYAHAVPYANPNFYQQHFTY